MDHQSFAELLGNYGEFVGAIAVVVTLGYLAVQIRRTDTTARAQARQTLIDTWASRNWDLARDSRMSFAFSAALDRWPDLTGEEKFTFDCGMGSYLANIQNGILLRDSGLLDGEVLDRTADYMLMCITTPGGRRWWAETTNAWPQARAYLDQRVASGDSILSPADQSLGYWIKMSGESTAKGDDPNL